MTVLGHRCTRWALLAAFALALTWPAATGGAATTETGAVPAKLGGVWHKTMTKAEWARAGVLHVKLPKAGPAKLQRIEVRAD